MTDQHVSHANVKLAHRRTGNLWVGELMIMCINFTVVSQARPHKSINTQFSAKAETSGTELRSCCGGVG